MNYALISLVLTFCSGLQAIAFLVFRKDFDITWWAANLYLMIYPLFFIKDFIAEKNKDRLSRYDGSKLLVKCGYDLI